MNTILCFGLLICASLALTTAFPAAEPVPETTLNLDAPEPETDQEALQPEESHHHGWGGHHGGNGGGWGGGHGGYGGGYGGGGGRGGGRGGGWGHGGGGGYGR